MTGTAKIKTLIVDDETLARRRIRRLLATEGDVEVIGECGDSQQAIDFIQERNPDLVFLDVQMPGMDGFSVVESLPPQTKPAVIFVTAFDQYALRAFDVHALDYLMKPFDRARFRKALDRARNQMRQRSPVVLDEQITKLLDSLQPKPPERLVIKSAGRIMFLRKDEIDWIEAADNYVRLHVGTDSHLLRETLGALESRLDSSKFLRIHRSTVVNIDRMKELQPWFHGDYVVILQDGTRLNLSRTYRDRVIELLGEIF
ncbi:MAG TPA: LytTR family DNA-binding domain-containing protein [Bryobacteraceae bacterium]|nr:LytTR family DNA-binding domain-containing protein [Bryobacteraceae bacterium]